MGNNKKFELFMSLSKILTGFDELNEVIGRDYLIKLSQGMSNEILIDILKVYKSHISVNDDINNWIKNEISNNDPRRKLTREIIMLWYTGSFNDASGNTDIGDASHYFNGLMWKVIQAHPPGITGGAYGYWAHEPEGQQ